MSRRHKPQLPLPSPSLRSGSIRQITPGAHISRVLDNLLLGYDQKLRPSFGDTFIHNGKRSYVHLITTPNKFIRLAKTGRVLYSSRNNVGHVTRQEEEEEEEEEEAEEEEEEEEEDNEEATRTETQP
ncbi:Gamma-aminobutyric acid receptor alpha-like [Portunus trituberculatus]|uniref:Gamma-aminobutyric acid receptor alpha-like n=1 Tax=Portunus trituberculatus TaxID=210409 RepID=A0A5B7ERD5_PORTR|nr:Gamma-aminobutyric acid receptor alpha-like [Portunus trituberculatus]